MFTRYVLKRTLATVAARQTVTKAPSRLLDTLLGIVIVAPAIAFAPANTFDNLDCNSECQCKMLEGIYE